MHVCVCNGQRDDKRSNSVRGKFCTKLNVYKKSNNQKKKTLHGVWRRRNLCPSCVLDGDDSQNRKLTV